MMNDQTEFAVPAFHMYKADAEFRWRKLTQTLTQVMLSLPLHARFRGLSIPKRITQRDPSFDTLYQMDMSRWM